MQVWFTDKDFPNSKKYNDDIQSFLERIRKQLFYFINFKYIIQ